MQTEQRLQFAFRQVMDRGQGLSGFLSRLSIIGLVLAVAILLAVLSVMNGFERETRERILGLVPHVSIRGYADLSTWSDKLDGITRIAGVQRGSLFHEREVLAIRGTRVHAAALLGVSESAFEVWRPLLMPVTEGIKPGQVVVGSALAERLGLRVGGRLQLILPSGEPSAPSARPETATVEVVGMIRSGTELDERILLGNFDHVAGLGGREVTATGLALQLDDLFLAPRFRWQLSNELEPNFYASDWTASQGNLYAAIQLSRDLVGLLLLSIIAVAAFNVVSSLVLVVTDRRAAIAMLQTLGASRRDILVIFLAQGALIGVIGASLGVALGLLLALSAPYLAGGLEWLLGAQLLNTDVYPLSFLPVDIRPADIVRLWVVSVALCLIAAIIPARKAAKLPVAEILAQHSD